MNATPTEREPIKRYRVPGNPRQRVMWRMAWFAFYLLIALPLTAIFYYGIGLLGLLMSLSFITFTVVGHYHLLRVVYQIDVFADGEMVFHSHRARITLAPSHITRITGTIPMYDTRAPYKTLLTKKSTSRATLEYTPWGSTRSYALAIDANLDGFSDFLDELKAANPELEVVALGSQSTQ